MENSIFGLKENKKIEYVIEKSKFICYVFNVLDIDNVNYELKKIEKEHTSSTHICYAYIVNSQEKCSDNGEPAGTAGKPILEVLKKSKLTNVLAVVVRYFGGIKLGAGGLVRAYSKSVSLALENNIANFCKMKKYEIEVEINKYNNIISILQKNGIKVNNTNFGNSVTIVVCVKSEAIIQNFKMLNLIKDFKYIGEELVEE